MSSEQGGTHKRENWGSRIGYILSFLGMAIGLGAMWRFPMVAAQNGGGAFVLAFFLICIVMIPTGFGEIGLGRWARDGAAGAFEKVSGTKAVRPLGYIMAAIPYLLNVYYVIIVGTVFVYLFYTVTGAPFLDDTEAFYKQVEANRPLAYGMAVLIMALGGIVCAGGIKGGIEKICKILLPALFVILCVVVVRVCTLPGISAGIEFYVHPDFSTWLKPSLWVAAAGMALFAVGIGPGYLLTFGSYLSEKADIATDFVTINFIQLLICVLAGFATLPAVILFGINPQAGTGLVFMVLPRVFEQIPGGMIWFFMFLLALLFAGFSTVIGIFEVPLTTIVDGLKMDRKKACIWIAVTSMILMIPCVWNEGFLLILDYIVANVLYVLAALGMAFYLSWVRPGAKRVRDEWVNPSSVYKYGSWVDFFYKYINALALAYFAYSALVGLPGIF